ncbi:uncharacterized protein SPPG_00804 [Spizellomyces punctatus DAOM BR117]|uniref:RecA family profile 1 domain-containing protein n=1 Tax=Spizellomyces punctatus (strain DAOM BR117) TaxID=645134 RepID=A0A0L0HW80_SPIPD|nr:uncharacterized protein SPPG_00804 [Spizellomyces punctatus DAOM BR117]KND05134.1 hypothetical protein SPPG_00804 [Spizellomyces punctatus DAOM BR117]|eukprot:XP_016613173.1 hypothetical protein SPPG_00804 [Spizellomyces punctatus DAOM BR117]
MTILISIDWNDDKLTDATNKLASVGIRTVRDLLLADRQLLCRTGLSNETLNLLTDAVVELSQSKPTPGDVALEEQRAQHKFLSTGCPGIDQLLEGGLALGEFVEFAGPPATGKTQLCFFTAITTTADDPTATVLYIDSGNAFSASRLSDMYTYSDRFQQSRESGMDTKNILSRVRCIPCFDAFSLVDIMEEVQKSLADKTTDFFSMVRLLIIDSIGALLSPMVGYGQSQGYVIMMTIAQILKSIALSHGISILVTNYSVSSDFKSTDVGRPFSGGKEGARRERTKPALGTTWSYVPNVRLYFTLDEEPSIEGKEDDEVLTYRNRQGDIIPLVKRRIDIYASHRLRAGDGCHLYIGSSELLSFPSQ